MIYNFPLVAYLYQMPLQQVIDAGKNFGVSDTIEMYANRCEGCSYKVSNYIYQNELCCLYDDYTNTIMISLKDNTIWIDRYRLWASTPATTEDLSKIHNADKWFDELICISYEEFLAMSKDTCKALLNNPNVNQKIREIAATIEVKPVDELCSVTESVSIEGLFDAAMEADSITDGLNQLDKISGNDVGGGDSSGGEPPADNRETTADDGESPDLTQATQDDMDKENEGDDDDPFSADDPFGSDDSGGDAAGGSDSGSSMDTSSSLSGDSSNNNTEDDPMKSVEVKVAYRDRFVKLYDIIEDALTTMETFSPDYSTKISAKYYTIQMDLTHLKEAIYRICTRRLNKMSVPEVLRAYTIANNIFDISTRMMKEFFDEYNTEVDKMSKKSGKSQ